MPDPVEDTGEQILVCTNTGYADCLSSERTSFNDWFRSLKSHSATNRFFLALQGVFPILEWIQTYDLHKLKVDVVAGITIASLSIPQDTASKLANLEPEYGLHTSFVPPLVYAMMGSSRHMAIGPVPVVSLLLGTLLQKEVDPDDELQYRRLAFTATFFAGITTLTLGILRLGFLIDFLSHAAIVGFMGGAAVTIALQQLQDLLGIVHFTNRTDIVSVLRSVVQAWPHGWNWQTAVIGVIFLLFLLFCKHIGKRKKDLFWVPAVAPLISLIVLTLFVRIIHLEKSGVQIVNDIKEGINPSSAREIYFTGKEALVGFRIGIVCGLIGLTEAVAIGRTFASKKGYTIDGNKEMVALGTMNIIGSFTSCYVATGSFTRSAVNVMAGCQTPASNIVMSVIVLLTLLFMTPLFKYTPNAILAAIIIAAVTGLVDVGSAVMLWKVDKFDFAACMGAFFGVVFISVETGLLVAIGISFAKILLHVTRPRVQVLGNIPTTESYRSVEQCPEATRIPGILIVRVDSAMYFTNANYIRDRVLFLLHREEEELVEFRMRMQYVIFDMTTVADVDTSGIQALRDIFWNLEKKDIKFVITNPGMAVMKKFHSAQFLELVGDEIFQSLAEAVANCTKSKDEVLR